MENEIRTLNFYGFDCGCKTEDGSNFIKTDENLIGTVSKTVEYDVVNKFGK